MSSNFSRENFIFKDERFLYPEFVPERLPFRDKEISDLVFCFKPASIGKKPTNVFVFGKPGTGKTVTLKFVLNELLETSDRVKCLYVNCFENSTKNSILVKATNSFGYPVPSRGFSSQEVLERLVALIKSKNFVPLIVFDEAEQLLKSSDSISLIYELARIGEQKKIFLGLAFVSNDSFFASRLDERIRSSLQLYDVEFKPYTVPELKEILRERTKYAFFDNVVSDDVLGLCAANAFKLGGDARVAISVLLKAGRIAERENSATITLSHVRLALMQEKPVKVEIFSNLSEQEKLILDAVKNKPLESGEIYKLLSGKFKERSLRLAISSLEKKGLITITEVKKPRGSTRLISTKNKNISL